VQPNAASVALIEAERVLLIQRTFEPYGRLWTLPGGRREPSEAIEATAVREIAEELGLAVSALQPVTSMHLKGGFLLQVFATSMFIGTIVPSSEIAAHRWLRPDEIGDLPTTPDLDEVLAKAFAVIRR